MANLLSSRFNPVYVALLVFVTISVLPSTHGMKCRVILDLPEEWEKVFRECFKTNPMSLDKSPYRNATIEDYDFDDNCFQQCVYKGVGLLTPEGKLKKETKETASSYLKKNELDEDIFDKLVAIWNECMDISEKIGKEKGFNECKTLGLHDFCFEEKLFDDKGILERKC